MRSFRVFNDVTGVRIIWKFGGVRLGGIAQVAMLLTMAVSTALILIAGILPAAVTFVVGFLTISLYAITLSRIDESGKLGDLTALHLLSRGLRHRRSANFDLPGI
ncbi:hypothetical protein [Mycolicibacterium sp.]|uniref:hypothetical protein n=1 Tax=Mycolicibacterium sp. TaxID=2320850 RepID=UPI00355E54E3